MPMTPTLILKIRVAAETDKWAGVVEALRHQAGMSLGRTFHPRPLRRSTSGPAHVGFAIRRKRIAHGRRVTLWVPSDHNARMR